MQRWSGELIIGHTFRPWDFLQFKDGTGSTASPIPIDGASFTFEIRTEIKGGDLVLSVPIEVLDAELGKIRALADAADTEGVTPGTYPYALIAMWEDSTSAPVLEGVISCRHTVGA